VAPVKEETAMSVVIALLRGVNVTGNHMVKMETLRALCSALGCTEVQTYLQSGNLVFRAKEKTPKQLLALGERIEDAIEAEFGFRVPVVLRAAADLQAVVAANPFVQQAEDEPGKVQVVFLYRAPSEAQLKSVRAMRFSPELVWVGERELIVYYPTGQGQSKLRWGPIDKALGTPGTARNWNSVTKLLEMAEAME
jgi:uncharacterized protein (DUF1697 family)